MASASASAGAGDSPGYFGLDFGQKIDLTVRIREILRNYPEGTSIFKEMVQNADDAGATEVRFCLDYRRHAAQRLAYQKLAPFQGPSLLVFNNATFTDADFESIQRIGDSLKKDNSNGWKTGRFGVGFNSVYHVTDLPAFVSGPQLVFFDPQACHLPNVNPSNPGKMINFIEHPNLVTEYPDQVAPFRCFGCDFAQPFEGTLFRLALRSEEQAAKSRLTSRVQTPEHVGAMLDEFADSLHLVLLFLRNVTKISVLEWRDGVDDPVVRREVEISNMNAVIKSKRMVKNMSDSSALGFAETGIACDYTLCMTARNFVDTLSESTHTFAIYNQLGGGSCARIANDPGNANQRLVPWGGVAVPTSVSGQFPRTTGMAFCFLPLPTQTYLPIHVNGYFELSSNRRDIWFGDGLSGDGLLRAQWNLALLRDVIGPCYARALLDLTINGMISPQDHKNLFPDTTPPAPWNELIVSVLRRVRAVKCLRCDVNGGEWVCPSQCSILRRDVPCYFDLLQWLTEDGMPIVKNLSPDLERLLVETETIPGYLEPITLRQAFSSRRSVHSGNREAVKALVNFMLSDLSIDTLGYLDRVNFLPTADGALGTFYRQLAVDTTSLEQLSSMGFSRHHCRKALVAVGGRSVERALNWILQNPDPISDIDSEDRLFLIPSAEQMQLLTNAKARLVDSTALNDKNLKLLCSENIHDVLNIKNMGIIEFEETLSLIFPSDWHRKSFVIWNRDEDTDSSGLSEQWFRDLWSYIGRSDQLSVFCDKWPIVPTSAGLLVSLSTSCGVLSPELIPRAVLTCLQKLHVRLLIPNLFAASQPNPVVWQYIQQPTAEGVVQALKVVLSSYRDDQQSLTGLFESTTQEDREQLLAFLASGASGDLKAHQLDIIRGLPLFGGFTKSDSDSGSGWISDGEDQSAFGAANLAGYSRTFVSALKPDGTLRSMCMGLGWQLLDDNFIFVKENDAETWRFLARLGVEEVSSVEFVAHHLIPRLHELPSEARADAICYLLQHLATLLAEDYDGALSAMLEAVPIFPSRVGELKRIGDLYDPDMDEFADIMDDSFFPAVELQDPQPLAMLRSIGLQRALSRRSILSLAVSIEQDQENLGSTNTDTSEPNSIEEKRDRLRIRSSKFLQYLDSHLDQLTTPQLIERTKPKAPRKAFTKKGLKFLRTFLGEEGQPGPTSPKPDIAELERREVERREIDDLLAKLAVIAWVPVLEARPSAVLPWQQDQLPRIVVPPLESCPEKHMWLCSSEYYVVKNPVHSDVLRRLLGWNNGIPIEVIATQLRSISLNFSDVVVGKDPHAVWTAVFELYKRLSHFFESEASGSALLKKVQHILLDGGEYIWIGNSFVSPLKVAATALVNAEPYLYTIPSELLHFRPLFKAIGVRERFEVIDYIHALGAIYANCQTPEGTNTTPDSEKTLPARSLKADELTMVIGLIQLISDKVMNHTDYELFAPDTDGNLVHSATLTFDDAPWLDKNEFKTPLGGALRFVHPKISNEVAAKIGAKSLRSQLLHSNVHESISFSTDGGIEAFGQSEALTKRISRILEQYPDGPNILSELIQNADDACASSVRIMYDNCSYETSSLLSPGMAKWQGPALYCYNDAEFSDSDFINLARIGQGSKLQRATTTGRFGLGFNSVYHFTDLPTIVSANSIVMFDPHATHLPGISTANPGLKIRFVNSNVVSQFPDQFAPLTGVFGCNLHDHFHGTLFRFPLRTSELADTSEIKRRSYSRREVAALFRRFRESVAETMLFLRNIRSVEVYAKFHKDEAPVLLFGANASAENHSGSWSQVTTFMKGDDPSIGNGLSAKRDFYARLRAKPEAELPSITQVVKIQMTERTELSDFLTVFEDDPCAAQSWCSSSADQNDLNLMTAEYLVCNRIGGGKAREMACAPENASLKLIPWAGIAGRIDNGVTDGRAFCFLPLPVRVGLPVHVNGYFELSSNRRDVWHGDDMTGEGKLRSEWNANLLADAVAPAYITFLAAARDICGDNVEKYFSLFPTRVPSQPWDNIVVELFHRMKDHPVFISRCINSPVSPGIAVAIDETVPEWEQLEVALVAAKLPTVLLPRPLHDLVVQLDAVRGAMTPALFRSLVQDGSLLPSLGQEVSRCVIGFCLRDGSTGAATCSLEELNGLPILPLRNGSYHRLTLTDDTSTLRNCYFGSPNEEELLTVFPDRVVCGDYRPLFDALPNVFEKSNLRVVNLDIIASEFFPLLVGAHLQPSPSGVFKLSEDESSSKRLNSRDWMNALWQYVETILINGAALPSNYLQLPVLPVMLGKDETGWIRLSSQFGVVVRYNDSSTTTESEFQELVSSLSCIHIFVVDPSVISGDKTVLWLLQQKIAHKLSPGGLLMAIERVHMMNGRRGFDGIFTEATEQARLTICSFLSGGGMNTVPNSCEPILFDLPIFPVYSANIDSSSAIAIRQQFVTLRRGGFLPDMDADARLLDSSFFKVESETTRKFLRDCGVDEWSNTKILMDFVFPRLEEIEKRSPLLVDETLVAALSTLPFHQKVDPQFRTFIQTQAIFPSRKRVFRRVSELHDPNSKELSNLVGENSLPAEAFASQDIVDILRTLGLRMGLSCHAVLESARSVEGMLEEGEASEAPNEAWEKACSLLAIVNKHFDSMAASIKHENGEDASVDSSLLEIVECLRDVRWLPVSSTSSDSLMPWRPVGLNKHLASPAETRPRHLSWFCSSMLYILEGELTSQELIAAFGWDQPIEAETLAHQLIALANQWDAQSSAGESATNDERTPRFPLPEVRQMYELLEKYRISNKDAWEASSIALKLSQVKWLWTGKAFASIDQIAVESEANLEPLLFSMPGEHIIPRSLIEAFSPKSSFGVADLLQALARLPRRVVMDSQTTNACFKIFSLMEREENLREAVAVVETLSPGDVVLLDVSNRLIPASQLTYEDMEWNESVEVRRGTLFVHKDIANDVAAAMGATSLHSKLSETSVRSRRVACPSAVGLKSILPVPASWYHTFFTDALVAAERVGASQLHFFVDYRHHAAQKVLQPSLQPLQTEAFCIHLEGVVLGEQEINSLFRGETSRAGLLCGFAGSDCMQILSGNAFYVLDPTGSYLAPPTSSPTLGNLHHQRNNLQGIGRQYDLLGPTFRQYSDQLLPFMSLPTNQGNVSQGTRSTLIRFPWRKSESSISSLVMSKRRARKLIDHLKAQLHHALLFTESVYRVSVWAIGEESEFARHCHGEAAINNPESVLRKRVVTQHNDEWKRKNFSLQSFFKSVVTPENQMDFTINLELENVSHRDTWLFSDNIAAGRSRDLACSPIHEPLQSTPYVSVACHILRDGNPSPRQSGRLFKIVDTGQRTGLPVHINGCFKTSLKDKELVITSGRTNAPQTGDTLSGSENSIKANWNRVLLEDSVVEAYLKLLLIAKRLLAGSHPKALYNIWPSLYKVGETSVGSVLQSHMYRQLATQELFLCSDGQFRGLSNGYVLDTSNMDMQVTAFAQLHFPAFDIPKKILNECFSLLPSRVHKLTPQTMRRALKNINTGGLHADACLSILEYCLSDISVPLPIETNPVWAEFNGLALLPLEDGSVGVIRVNQRNRFVLASYNQVKLLDPMQRMFVSLAARQRLHRYFSDPRFLSVMGLSVFSIKTLADNVERILPSRWKNQDFVAWDPGSADEIDRLWLYRFWQEVRFEHRSLGYFAAWPLIPTKGSRLVSCGKPEAALCIWLQSGDIELASQNNSQYTDAAAANEAEQTEREQERQRLRGLLILDDQVDDHNDVHSAEASDRDDEEASDVSEDDNGEAGEDASHGNVAAVPPSSDAEELATEETLVEVEELSAPPLQENEESSHVDDIEMVSSEVVPAFEENASVETGDGAVNDASTTLTALDHLCSRERLHEMLSSVGIPLVELAYFSGQENEIVARSAEVATSIVDAVFAAIGNQSMFAWDVLTNDEAILMVEYLSLHGDTYGGYNRMYFEKLKQLPIYITCRGTRTPLSTGSFYIIPTEIDVDAFPLPPNSRQWFLPSNPRLNSFYRDLGVEEMSDAKLLLFVLPLFSELEVAQRNTVLTLILDKWQTLRGNAELLSLLKQAPIFRDSEGEEYREASAFFDPRNKVLSAIYTEVAGMPLAMRFQTPEWLNVLGEIGLRTDLSVDMFLECARRVDADCSARQCLSAADERLVVTLHQFFVQNFEKFDRSRTFFDSVSTIAFVPALLYEDNSARRAATGSPGFRNFTARLVVCRYSECVTPEEQALAFTTMPIIHGAAVPPRVLWSRLRLSSPPPKEKVLAHLAVITHRGDSVNGEVSSRTLNWQFFIPVVDVFQAVFKYLQSHWDELDNSERHQLSDSAVIPVGSDLVKGSRLFFHLAESLAPLMFEVPRAFGAYDTLFRQMGSKESPSAEDYIQLLQELYNECGGNALNLNELLAVCRVVKHLANSVAEMGTMPSIEDQRRIFLPSSTSVMQPMLSMANNDALWLSARIELKELHLVHPRILAPVCQLLGVPALSTVVTEEMDQSVEQVSSAVHSQLSSTIYLMNTALASAQFGNGLRRIISVQHQKAAAPNDFSGGGPDFEDLDRRIGALAAFAIKEVGEVQSRFVARVGLPPRTIDVTQASARTSSVSFVDHEKRVIYVSSSTLRNNRSMRVGQIVASSINQLLGGPIQDCTPIESILQCDVNEITDVLRLLNITEDPSLIAEKLRGTLGEILTDADRSNVELSPLRSCLPGEIVAVQVDGSFRYAKIVEARTSATEVTRYNVRVSKSTSRWFLATEIYFFRSGRNAGVSRSSGIGEARQADAVETIISTNSFSLREMPSTLAASGVDGTSSHSSEISASPVGAASVMSAANDLLSRLNVSLSSDFEDLVNEVERLKQQLEMAEESRRIAAAQIDEAIRDKRDAEDALICAICLEARVNRVLVPCGHIYCGDCVDRLPRAQCPLCRSRIASHSAFHVPS